MEGPRASLLFKPIFQKYMETHDVAGDDKQLANYKCTLRGWAEQAGELAAPFTAVDWLISVNQLEMYRFDDDVAQSPTVPGLRT